MSTTATESTAEVEVDEVICSQCKTVFVGSTGDNCLVRSCDGVGEALPPEDDDTDAREPDAPAEETGPTLIECEVECYGRFRQQQAKARRAYSAYQRAKESASSAKKACELENEKLRDLEPDLQTRLPFKGDETPDRASVRLDTLGLGEWIVEKLAEAGELGVTTIGDVQDVTETGGQLTGIDGIGPESAAKIADAIAKWDEANPADDEPADDATDDGESDDSEAT